MRSIDGWRLGESKVCAATIARTITVNQQTRNKQTTTPEGRTRRTVPMTTRLHDALKRMSVIRDGLVVRNLDGSAKTDDQADKAIPISACSRCWERAAASN